MHSNSQALFQKVSGMVMDKDNKQPLAGASIKVIDLEKEYSTASDSLGNFVFEQVPVGRVRIQCSYVGYEDFITDGLVLNSAKALEVNIEMEGSKQQQQNVIIRTKRNPKLPVNKYAIVSGRSCTAEETQRFAASANDPGRMAVGFPGVQATRDTRNDIIIRGNNPVGLQWKLEGIDIIN
ncbi:MAG TPA: carboxypeptidase-like regulatory domain-containing protein, partial [Flavisolibacter sp.]